MDPSGCALAALFLNILNLFTPVYNSPNVVIRLSICSLVALFLYILKWFTPVYNGPSVVTCPFVWALVTLFLYVLKWLSGSVNYVEIIHFIMYGTAVYLHINLYEKYNKISSNMHKHLVQQKVQEGVHNNFAAFFIKLFMFNKVWNSRVTKSSYAK